MTAAQPLESKPNKQRELLLAAALEVFSRQGFEGATVRDIAARAQCNHATIRYHYSTKDNLWRESVKFLFERMERELAVDGETSAKLYSGNSKAFELWLRRYVSYCARHPEHARIMVQASIKDDERLSWAVETFIAPQHVRIMKILRSLIASGAMPDIDPVHMAYTLTATCQSIFTLEAEARRLHDWCIDEAAVERYADSVIAMLRFSSLVENP